MPLDPTSQAFKDQRSQQSPAFTRHRNSYHVVRPTAGPFITARPYTPLEKHQCTDSSGRSATSSPRSPRLALSTSSALRSAQNFARTMPNPVRLGSTSARPLETFEMSCAQCASTPVPARHDRFAQDSRAWPIFSTSRRLSEPRHMYDAKRVYTSNSKCHYYRLSAVVFAFSALFN